MKTPWILAMLAGTTAAACSSSSATYEPLGVAGTRLPAAIYYHVVLGGRRLGQVKVWSSGGFRAKTGEKKMVVDVGLRIGNDSSGPMQLVLEKSDVDLTTSGGQIVVVEQPTTMTGDLSAAPESTTRISLQYALPPGVDPDTIAAFDFNWLLRTSAGPFSQSTTFLRTSHGAYAVQPYFYPGLPP